MKKCAQCNQTYLDSKNYCPICGQALSIESDLSANDTDNPVTESTALNPADNNSLREKPSLSTKQTIALVISFIIGIAIFLFLLSFVYNLMLPDKNKIDKTFHLGFKKHVTPPVVSVYQKVFETSKDRITVGIKSIGDTAFFDNLTTVTSKTTDSRMAILYILYKDGNPTKAQINYHQLRTTIVEMAYSTLQGAVYFIDSTSNIAFTDSVINAKLNGVCKYSSPTLMFTGPVSFGIPNGDYYSSSTGSSGTFNCTFNNEGADVTEYPNKFLEVVEPIRSNKLTSAQLEEYKNNYYLDKTLYGYGQINDIRPGLLAKSIIEINIGNEHVVDLMSDNDPDIYKDIAKGQTIYFKGIGNSSVSLYYTLANPEIISHSEYAAEIGSHAPEIISILKTYSKKTADLESIIKNKMEVISQHFTSQRSFAKDTGQTISDSLNDWSMINKP